MRRILPVARKMIRSGRDTLRKELISGWFIGLRVARRELVERMRSGDGELQDQRVGTGSNRLLQDVETAEHFVVQDLKQMRKTEQDLIEGRKCTPWRVKLAYTEKARSSVTNRWLRERLHRDTVTTVSNALVAYKRELYPVTASMH